MTTSQTLTLVLAVWGALLSTGLGLWTIIRDRREDGQLRIRVWVGRATRSNKSVSPFCSFDVVNVGRRKVYFGGVILHDGKGGYIDQVLGPGEPGAYMTLEPGEVCENDPGDSYEDVDRLLRTRRIFAIDTRRGRTYMPRWRVWKMRRQIRNIQAEQRQIAAKGPTPAS